MQAMKTSPGNEFAGKNQRTIYPPTSSSFGMSSGALLSVTLGEDEEVLWHWTYRDGRSVVTGYSMVPGSFQSLLDRLPK